MGPSQPHFYIIDDDISFGSSLIRLLNAGNITAEYFGSAQSFFDSVPSSAPGYAVIDVHMPTCGGLEMIDRMRDLKYRMSVIVITGHAEDDVRTLALEKGALGFLQKPFSKESLEELIDKTRNDV